MALGDPAGQAADQRLRCAEVGGWLERLGAEHENGRRWLEDAMGLAGVLRDTLGVPVPALERPAWDETQAALRRQLSEEERYAANTRGAAVRVPDLLTETASRGW